MLAVAGETDAAAAPPPVPSAVPVVEAVVVFAAVVAVVDLSPATELSAVDPKRPDQERN